jgi:hypothetical protein
MSSGVPIPVGTPCVANVAPINMPREPMSTGGLSAHRMYARGRCGNRGMMPAGHFNMMMHRAGESPRERVHGCIGIICTQTGCALYIAVQLMLLLSLPLSRALQHACRAMLS